MLNILGALALMMRKDYEPLLPGVIIKADTNLTSYFLGAQVKPEVLMAEIQELRDLVGPPTRRRESAAQNRTFTSSMTRSKKSCVDREVIMTCSFLLIHRYKYVSFHDVVLR